MMFCILELIGTQEMLLMPLNLIAALKVFNQKSYMQIDTLKPKKYYLNYLYFYFHSTKKKVFAIMGFYSFIAE